MIDQYKFGGGIPSIAKWQGGSVLDTSGSANVYDGTLNGSPLPSKTTGINGVADTAYSFVSANNQYAGFGAISELSNVVEYSISTWMKKASGTELFVGNTTGATGYGVYITWASDNILYVLSRNNSLNFATYDLSGAAGGDYVHIVSTKQAGVTEADKFKCYINSTLVTLTFNGIMPPLTYTSSDPFQWALRAVGRKSDGDIGTTYVFDNSIDQATVDQLYAEKTV